MKLFKKELKLAGYWTYESHPRWKYLGYSIYLDVMDGRTIGPIAKYILKSDEWELLS